MKKLFKIFMVIALTVLMTATSLPVNTVFAEDVPTNETSDEPAGTEEENKETVPGEAPADNADVTDGQPTDDGTAPAEEPADEEPVVEEEKTVEQLVYEVAEEQGDVTEAPAEEPETEEPVVLNAKAFEREYTVGDLTVKVSYEAGTVPEGTDVVVGEAKPEALEALKAELGEEANFAAADISFVWNDEEIEPKDFSENKVTVALTYAGEEDLGDTTFETYHVAETLNEEGTVVYSVHGFEGTVRDITKTVPKYKTESRYVRTDKVEDGTEEVTEYETREVTEEKTTYVTKTRQVEKTETVKVRVAIKWWDPSTWRGYKYVTRTYYVTEEYQEPVTETVVSYVQVPVTKTVTKYKDVDIYEDVQVEDGTEEIVIGVAFEADDFSTYVISWGNRSYNIHYVDTDGKSLTPTRTPEFSNDYKFLIYDVEGYVYDSTHYGSRTGTAIKPLLANYGNERIYLDNNNWQYLRNDIYVVYKKATEPTSGGTPKVDTDEKWPEGNDAPQFSKTSTYNGDGTNTIALSITGGEKPVEKTTPADVIVVFDVSGSMSDSMGNSTRLQRAKTAVNTMANTLLNGTNKGVKMALISYSTDARVVQEFTDNYTTFSGKVNGLSADGGTNWEKGLLLANQMEVRSDAATFVVFVTDGDPTFRVSRGNVTDSDLDMYSDGTYQYYRNNAIFGEGNDDSEGRNFDFAVKQVQNINSKKKEFFAIGISNDVTKVQNLTTQGGVDASHAFIASNATAMENAFKSITESIKSKLGFGDVEITDGITALSNTEMEVMQTVDPNSFKYYRWGGENNVYGQDEAHKTEWTTREEDGCGAASYDKTAGTVNWNMGDGFQLEDGVHYVVTFRVWASQEAYDLVADLNNGVKTYSDLTDAEKAQIVEVTTTNPVTYALKTNTDEVNATYKKTTKTGDTVTVSDNTPIDATYTPGTQENLALESMKLTIKKEFEDDLTAGEDRETEVTLVVYRRNAHQNPEEEFAVYPVPQNGGTSENVVLNEGNNWTYEFYVAPGVEVNGEVLEHGYDFTIKEPGIDYHYGLIEEVINPMVVDGEDMYYGDGYLIDDDTTVAQYTDRSLTAVNRVKSGIDVKKVVVDKDGKEILPDEEFTIVGKILDANGNPFTWQDGDDVNKSGAYHKYDKEGNRIVYKGHFASTDNIEFTLKAGEYVRFINVPDGCTFEFEEKTSAMPAGYEWKESTGVTQHRVSAGGEFTPEGDVQPTVTGGKVELTTGVVGNKQYSVTFTNTAVNGEYFFVYHSSDNTIEKVFTEDARVTKGAYHEVTKTYEYTFDIAAETKEGTLYGGYYHAYAGQKATDTEIPDLTYDATNWAKDDDATPYDAKKSNVWKRDQAYTEDPGTAMHPTAGSVYYLKEVPNGYIRPYVHYTYDDYDDAKPIKKFYIITATDDTNYKGAGYVELPDEVKKDAPKRSLTVSIKKPDGTADATLTAKSVFNDKYGVTRGYLYWGDRSDLIGQTSFQYVPCWETLDGVLVKGVTVRTVKNITSHKEISADDVAD